jgi:glucokinase
MNAIGIDIGATKIRGIVADNRGKIFFQREIETMAKRKKAQILSDIIDVVIFLKKSAEKKHLKLSGIGIGAPGITKKGKIIFGGGTLKQLKGINLASYIKKETGLKTFADNDSKLFALAESYFGAGKNYNRVAGIIWGTGIGSGFIDKKNKTAKQIEIGHLVVEPDMKSEPKDACGARSCVENLASGKNIVRRYYAKGGKISAKGGSASGGKNVGVREIYLSKEKVAKEVLEDAYKYLGMAIAILIRAAKPEIVVIGGGVSNLPKPAHDKLKKYICKFASKAAKKIKIAKSKLGNFSGALGAAMLVSGSE